VAWLEQRQLSETTGPLLPDGVDDGRSRFEVSGREHPKAPAGARHALEAPLIVQTVEAHLVASHAGSQPNEMLEIDDRHEILHPGFDAIEAAAAEERHHLVRRVEQVVASLCRRIGGSGAKLIQTLGPDSRRGGRKIAAPG